MSRIIDLRKKRKEKNFRSKVILWLVISIASIIIILYFAIDIARINRIMVVGQKHYSQEEIIQMVGISKGDTILDIYFREKDNYSSYAYIKSIKVTYSGLTSIYIQVEEKDIINYIKYQDDYLALDKSGYVIDYLVMIDKTVPLIEGIYLQSAIVGTKLDISEETSRVLLDLYHLRNKYQIPISRIEFQENNINHLTIYVGKLKIIFGETLELDKKMKSTKTILDKLGMDISGTLNLEEDTESFILKKNSN